MKNYIRKVLVWTFIAFISCPSLIRADVSVRTLTDLFIAIGVIPKANEHVAEAILANVRTSNRLINTSVRGYVSGGKPTFTYGFVVGQGDAYGTYFIRAVGQGLAKFGATELLADPVLKIMDSSGATVFVQDDWSGSNGMSVDALRYWQNQSGAFSIEMNHLDSAVAISLAPGAYTVTVEGFGGNSGNALLEVFQISSEQSVQALLQPVNVGKG